MKTPFCPVVSKNSGHAGFTLVELLVVVAIIAILATGSITAFSSVNSALNLSQAAQQITSEITTARQTALTYSETVEVRFYLYTDPMTGANQYQAIQTFSSPDGSNFTQMDRISYLPKNIMIDQTTLSYPFGESSTTVNPVITASTAPGTQTINGVGTNYQYKSLRFKPGGGVDFILPSSGAPANWPPSSWYITLYEKKYFKATPSMIKNFITINVDSLDGRIRTFQP